MTGIAAFLFGAAVAAWFAASLAGFNPPHIPGGKWLLVPGLPLAAIAAEALKMAAQLSVRRDREAAGLENAKVYKWEWAASALLLGAILTTVATLAFAGPLSVVRAALWPAAIAALLLLVGLTQRRWRKG